MEFRRLGRTGLQVSRVALGSGGANRLGQMRGATSAEIGALVGTALDLGINFFDTAPVYADSERLLGETLAATPRDDYVVATKFHPGYDGPLPTAATLVESVEESLRRLRIETLDVLFLHAVIPERYQAATEELVPAMVGLQERGAVRFLGITEAQIRDPGHATLELALGDGTFDVVMAAYNILNQSSAVRLFDLASAGDIGVIVMTAVRRALANPALLEERLSDAVARQLIDAEALPPHDPLGWLIHDGVDSVAAAAYKFAAAPDQVATVLTGTADRLHLAQNVAAVLGAPLPASDMDRLRSVFAGLAEPLAE